MDQYHYLFKFILIGDYRVGKSNILLQYTDKKFIEKEPTVGVEFGSELIQLKDKTIRLQIWDLSGSVTFRSITRSYYRFTIGVFVVFDITNRESFNNVQFWYNDIKDMITEDCQFVLVGNKLDLEAERKISTLEAQEFAEKYKMQYAEVSAKAGKNIVEPFTNLAMNILIGIENKPQDEHLYSKIMLQNMQNNGIKEGPLLKQEKN